MAIKPCFGIENVDLVFLTAVVGVAVRYGLWPSLLASVAASLAYNFFFLPPVYTFTITDPTNVAAFFFFMLIAVAGLERRRRACARRRITALGRIRTTESALCVQPQARRHRHARRRALGNRLSDRADAEGSRGAAAAGGRAAHREGRLSARGPARPGRSRRRQLGLGATIVPPAAARTRCRAPSGCSCRCAPGAARSASSASTTTAPGRC